VVRIAEAEKPAAKDNEVLVRVHATTVNRTDCGLRAAKPFIVRFFTGLKGESPVYQRALPHQGELILAGHARFSSIVAATGHGGLIRPRVTVLGNDFAGEIESVGRGVTSFEVGDRVFGYNGSSFGAHAEYMVMPKDGLLTTMPASLTYEEAAPSTEGSHYALSLIRAAKLQRGQDVLVYGATGAIGSAAIQLLKHLSATVTAVCDGEHLQLVKSLGADRVIDYTAEERPPRRPGSGVPGAPCDPTLRRASPQRDRTVSRHRTARAVGAAAEHPRATSARIRSDP
jgi:NADPH:quinone reductase-like Zn-dependent oxidoreductase